MIKHTAENLDKWIQVATIECQYYKFIAFDKSTDSTHKLIRPLQVDSLFPISLTSKKHEGGRFIIHYSLP